jgi:alpha-beta hydrolase superfamily lysophospholipase
MIFMHPASTLQLLPVPRAMAATGAHVLCAGSRYQRNDTALIMEKVFLDLGAYIRHAKEVWGYKQVVLVGWSGGGALAVSYQAEAEDPPSPTRRPATRSTSRARADPRRRRVYQAAHLSRAHLLAEAIDPSVRDELNPTIATSNWTSTTRATRTSRPTAPEYIVRYRAAQLARMRRITAWAKATLAQLKARNTGEVERGFIVHRTLADPRFLDPALDPNDRKPRWCYLGNPETVNSGPVGLARFTTLRSWLSQWSLDDSCGNGLEGAKRIKAPLLVIENSADDARPADASEDAVRGSGSPDKTFAVIKGATHYYAGQPELLKEATALILGWLKQRKLLEN